MKFGDMAHGQNNNSFHRPTSLKRNSGVKTILKKKKKMACISAVSIFDIFSYRGI